jgi:hypothetical protein
VANSAAKIKKIEKRVTLGTQSEQPPAKMNVRYATTRDIGMIQELTRTDITRPRVTLICERAGKLLGWIVVEITGNSNGCTVKTLRMSLRDRSINEHLLGAVARDAIKCANHRDYYKKAVWGGIDLPTRRYAMITGDVPIEDRAAIQRAFNSVDNMHGEQIELLLISSTGAEGLDLKNVRHIHIIEPYWNYGRVEQIIARGVRNNSHVALPAEEKNVQPYIYLAVPPNKYACTDEELFNDSMANRAVIASFTEAFKEVAIECMLAGEDYCRVCNPTDTPLYNPGTNEDELLVNLRRELAAPDPCVGIKEKTTQANSIEVAGVKYYYNETPASIFGVKVYTYNAELDGYTELSESSDEFAAVVAALGREL